MNVRLNLIESKVFCETSCDEDVLGTFGESTNSCGSVEGLKAESDFQTMYTGSEYVTLTVSPSPGRADLHQRVAARFGTLEDDYGAVKFYYYLNGTSLKGVVSASCRLVKFYDEYEGWTFFYVYNGALLWYPDYFGNFFFLVVAKDVHNNTIGQNTVLFTVQPAPANIVVYYPEAFSGDKFKLMIAFSKSRIYEGSSSSDFFYSSRLAPTVLWDNVNYMLDQATNSTVIHVYVNGSRFADVVPDVNGICSVLVPVNFSGDYSGLNIRVVTNETTRYKEVAVERGFTLTRVSVVDVPSAGSNSCRLDFSLKVLDEGDRMYISLDNVVEVSASLFDSPIYNISASVVVARGVGRSATNSSGWALVPYGCNYLRVKSACYLQEGMASPLADVNRDGWVTMNDVGMFSNGVSTFGDARYNWTLDLNGDYRVDNDDIEIVTSNYGRHISYCSSDVENYDYSGVCIDFDNGQHVYLDSRGFAAVPDGVSWLNMPIGGIVEFYVLHSASNVSTNNVGVAEVDWCPEQTGVYALQVKLPSRVNVTTAWHSNITQVMASLNIAKYFYVEKRPVNFTIDMKGEFQIATFEADSDAYVFEYDQDRNYGYYDSLSVGYQWVRLTKYETISYIRFNLSSLPVDAYILSAMTNLYMWERAGPFPCTLDVYRVSSQWNELTISWNTQPTHVSNPSYTLNVSASEMSKWLSLNITEDVRMWQNGSAFNYGLALKMREFKDARMMFFSRESVYSDLRPFLLVSYVLPSSVLNVTVFDEVVGEPISGLPVQYYRNSVNIGSGVTNSSGFVAVDWSPTENIVYNVTVASLENEMYKSCVASSFFDFRFPTNITSKDGNSINVSAGISRAYYFNLNSPFSIFSFVSVPVKVFINGTYTDGTSYAWAIQLQTGRKVGFVFNWAAPSNGTYSMKAVYEGNANFKPSEIYVTVNAMITPLAVLFSVSPKEFEPGDLINLTATILYASNGSAFTGYNVKVAFYRVSSDGTNISNVIVSNTQGVAVWNNIVYPNDGKAYAFMAKIVPEYAGLVLPQGIASNPVQLTVSKSTRILLNVTKDDSSSEHLVEGWLVWKNSGVSGKTIKVKVNETDYTVMTSSGGYFSLSLNLQPKDDKATTYIVTASFEDEATQPITATAWAKTLDGQDYPACTTIQYGFKPSSNMTTLTVDPRVTELMRLAKSPEEMQKKAQDEGWLGIWHEFSWWYPWYRLHYVGKYNGQMMIDTGVAIFPFSDSGSFPPTQLKIKTDMWLGGKIAFNVITGVAVTEFAIWAASHLGPMYFIAVLLSYSLYKFLTLYANWNSLENLYITLVSTVFSIAISAWTGLCKFLPASLQALAAGAESIKNVVWAFICKIIMIPLNIFLLMTTWDRIVQLGGV